jgi:SAM-dependent methyltransferase
MSTPVNGPGFSHVDTSTNPEYFVNYLDSIGATPIMDSLERQIVSRLQIEPGRRYLDVGCGTGDDARAMAALVGPGGWVVGVDTSATMVEEANKRSAGMALPVEFRRADAAALDFADASFDGCRTERVLQHVAEPAAVITEMARVTKPGGRVVCLEPDWEALVVDAPDRVTTRRILNFRCDCYQSGWVGRQLPGLFKQAGLTAIRVDLPSFALSDFNLADAVFELRVFAGRAVEAGRVTATAAAAWLDSLEQASTDGRFLVAVMPFLVSARKP